MTRAIVLSDLHGQMNLFENALKHSEYDPKSDRLIIAGDTCDIGNHTMAIHIAADELGAEELVGNHEISHLCGIEIRPYDVSLDPAYQGFIAIAISCGDMKLAAEHEGVLISHAGLSKRLATKGFTEGGREDSSFSTLHHSCILTAESAARILNERLSSRVHIRMIEGDDGSHPIMDVDQDPMWTDWFYPFWFRPYMAPDYGQVAECGFYDGFKQVVGHTPVSSFSSKQQRLIHGSGVSLTDPYARAVFEYPDRFKDHYRYVVIEDGQVTVHDSRKDK
jgi:hypothetical protein